MSRDRQDLGAFGEEYAAARLRKSGYRILERNVRFRSGEIDIVAEEKGAIVFVEVRTRRSDRFGPPEESVTDQKAHRLIELGEQYLQTRRMRERPWRIDLVALEVDSRGAVTRFDLYKNAVE